jgi:hypothetical protein
MKATHLTVTLRIVACAVLAALIAPVAGAEPKGKNVDLFWQRADFDSLRIKSIAFLPTVSFDHDLQKEQEAEDAMAQTIRGVVYRWLSPTSVQALCKARPAADSVWKVQRERVLKSPQARIDSLAAPILCAALRVNALLSLRVDRMEKVEPEWNQAGKPTTTIACHAALVDSAGRLLWTASGTETGEGQYYDPNAGVQSVSGSGLSAKPKTGQMGAPEYKDVGARLFERWAQAFPRPAGVALPPKPSN